MRLTSPFYPASRARIIKFDCSPFAGLSAKMANSFCAYMLIVSNHCVCRFVVWLNYIRLNGFSVVNQRCLGVISHFILFLNVNLLYVR